MQNFIPMQFEMMEPDDGASPNSSSMGSIPDQKKSKKWYVNITGICDAHGSTAP